MASSPDALQGRLDQVEANVSRWQRINRFRVWSLLVFIAALYSFLRLEASRGTAMLAVKHDGAAMLVFERDGQVVGRVP